MNSGGYSSYTRNSLATSAKAQRAGGSLQGESRMPPGPRSNAHASVAPERLPRPRRSWAERARQALAGGFTVGGCVIGEDACA